MPKQSFSNILSLSAEEVMDFLLQSKHYHEFELPEYFDFDAVLQFVKEKIGNKSYAECCNDEKTGASAEKNVNFNLILNKDGKYGIRPLALCNPYLYYFLVREICSFENWNKIKEHFEMCQVPNINACAIPVVPEHKEPFYKSTTILNWWNQMEQQSIELSLEYKCMFVTDITNCYGSINPDSIEWALNRRNTEKYTNQNRTIANNITRYLRDMQQGRNIGIPQGSTIFDIVGEIILSYADLLLSEKMKENGIHDGYKVLRYRDDYKIFCNSKDRLEKISYLLQEVLESLNFRMNTSKTAISNSIITDSIKPDKLYYIENKPIMNKKWCVFDGFQKHLLFILMFSRKFPNSGQLKVMLTHLDKRIEERLTQKNEIIRLGIPTSFEELLGNKEEEELSDNNANTENILDNTANDNEAENKEEITTNEEFENINSDEEILEIKEEPMTGHLVENVRAMCAIATQIAIENITSVHYALRVISRMVNSLDDEEEKMDIVEKVCQKLSSHPNSTYTKLWLQNMTYVYDMQKGKNRFSIPLCELVMNGVLQEEITLWNNRWLKRELTEDFPQESIVNGEKLEKVTPVITFRETREYWDLEDLVEDLDD
mgnify:CR=1 FL=1